VAVLLILVMAGCSRASETGAVPIATGQTGAGEPASGVAPVAGTTTRPPRSAPTLSPTPKSLLSRQADKRLKAEEAKLKKQAYFVVPNLVGSNLQTAQDKLQAKHSYLLIQIDATGANRHTIRDRDWQVCSQKPAAGTRMAVVKIVTLRAVKLTERCP